MKKIYFIIIILLFSISYSYGLDININPFFGGNSFAGANVCAEYYPGKISFLLDSAFIYSKINENQQYRYFSGLYIKFKLLSEELFFIDGLMGIGVSQSKYNSEIYGTLFSPNLGISLRYNISSDSYLDVKFPIFLYQDGGSVPWIAEYTFPIFQSMYLNLGMYGLTSFLIKTQSGMTTSIDIAGMGGMKYEF